MMDPVYKAIEEVLIANGVTWPKTTIANAIVRNLNLYGYYIVDRRETERWENG